MVSPRSVLDPLSQLGLGLVLWTWDQLCYALVGVFLVLLDDAASKLHSLDGGGKVVGPVTTPGVEVIEIDVRHVAGVFCDQCDVTCAVLSAGFQDLESFGPLMQA